MTIYISSWQYDNALVSTKCFWWLTYISMVREWEVTNTLVGYLLVPPVFPQHAVALPQAHHIPSYIKGRTHLGLN